MDGLPVQCVGAWAKDKSHYITNYIEASHAARRDFLPPKGEGGGVFVDLFAGPGRKRVRESGEVIDGSPLIALSHGAAPFSDVVGCDIEAENAAALRARFQARGTRGQVVEGDSNKKIDEVITLIPPLGLNLALVDPFGLSGLKFATFRRLGSIKRMDLIVHFPTGDIKRNLARDPEGTGALLDEALGTARWRGRRRDETDASELVETFVEELAKLGYRGTGFFAPAIKNRTDVPLYHLVFASKNALGDKIWASVIRTDPSGQTSLPLEGI